MEAIGRQVRLPINMAMQIAMQGIRIRLGRALVTISGVVLGIAFLMNAVAGAHIADAVKTEQDQRTKIEMMVALVKSDVGNPKGARVAVIACGTLEPHELKALDQLKKDGAEVVCAGDPIPGNTAVEVSAATQQADAVLVLGTAPDCKVSPTALTEKMKANQRVIIDSMDGRTYAGSSYLATIGINRELFFGKQTDDERQKAVLKKQNTTFRKWWIAIISLLVTIIGIANALLMSVTERFKEIGTMKCLGALSSFIRQLFLIESAVIGVVGSVVGILVGVIVPLMLYSFTFGAAIVLGAVNYGVLGILSLTCLFAGTLLSVLAAIYPATIAARMIPAMALRSNV